MAVAALLRATLQTLRSTVPGLTVNNSDVTYDAQPPASSGHDMFLCIYPTMWRPGPSADIHEAIEDEYSINLAINMRTSVIPRDRWGQQAYLNQTRSIEQASRELRVAMHRYRYDLINLANQYLGIDTDEGVEICEPLLFENSPMAPTPMDASWFHGEPEHEEDHVDFRLKKHRQSAMLHETLTGAAEPLEYHGLLLEMIYSGGRRIVPRDFGLFRITVNFLATENASPEITGSYGGSPDSIAATVDGQTYSPAFDNGIWSIPAGTVTLAPGVYDVEAEASYNNGETVAKDETLNEIQIIDPTKVWGWTDGQLHVWSDGQQAAWNQ